jgi:CRISPR-associated protein Csb2
MTDYICISATFLDARYHGRADRGQPEWPPSPLRLLQAIVAANGDRLEGDQDLEDALRWFECRRPPLIIAPPHEFAEPYCLSVPNNAMDLVGRAWARGNYFGTGDSSPATHRTMKTVRPVRLIGQPTVHFAWRLKGERSDERASAELIASAAERVAVLGWGIDLVAVRGQIMSTETVEGLAGERWDHWPSDGTAHLRTPVAGTLDELKARHAAFLRRMGPDGFSPVSPLARFDVVSYRRSTDPIGLPFALFELRHDDGAFCAYPQRNLIHIAGMVRHAAKRAMLQSPPFGVPEDWVERCVVGHRVESSESHRQFSYVPLPTIGHRHADQLIRRVMIVAHAGDERLLEHLAKHLAGSRLSPEDPDLFGEKGAPTLIRVRSDSVTRRYTQSASRWGTVTPVILPGHDDKRPEKTRRLIERALAHSRVEPSCSFEWSPWSSFAKSYSAHKYVVRDEVKTEVGYRRPDHLEGLTAVHLTLDFDRGVNVPGPFLVGAGRHYGLGLLAPLA